MGRNLVSASIAACHVLVVASSLAYGQAEQAGVSTRIDACVPIDRARFHRMLAIELGDAIDYLADAPQARSHSTISITCVAAGVELRLEDAVTRKSMLRIVDLTLVEPQSRTRLLALTVAEFLVASWLELRLPKQPLAPAVGSAPPPTAERAAARVVAGRLPDGPGAWQLEAAADVMVFADAFRVIPGLTLRVVPRLSNTFALSVGVQLGRGDLRGSLDNGGRGRQPVSIRLTTASLLAGVVYTGGFGDFEAEGGLGARFGVAYFSALTPARDPGLQAGSSSVPWGGPAAILGLRYRATSQLRIALQLEAGLLMLSGVAVEPRGEVVQLQHGWVGASVGLGWAF